MSPLVHFTSTQPFDGVWYPNTAATIHITSELANLNLQAVEHHGDDHLRVGDGSLVPIAPTGSTTFPSPYSQFLLTKLLCVPFFTKNLVCVYQFCLDNNVYFQFFSDGFCVKECNTKKTLLQWTTSNGLYTFSTLSPQAHSSTLSSVPLWHFRLTHPSLKIVHYILLQQGLLFEKFPSK